MKPQKNKPKGAYQRKLTPEQIRVFLDHIKNNYHDHYYLLFKIMVGTGLRLSEALYINNSDFSMDCSKLRVRLCKSDMIIERQIPDLLKEDIKHYLAKYGDRLFDGFLFCCKRKNKGHIIKATTVISMLVKVRRDLAKKDPSFLNKGTLYDLSTHALRAAYITGIYEASGNNLVLCKDIIGHKNIATTARYVRLTRGTQEHNIGNDILNRYRYFGEAQEI